MTAMAFRWKVSAGLMVLALAAGQAWAQTGGAGSGSGASGSGDSGSSRGVGPKALQDDKAGQLSQSDRAFVTRAAADGLFEVEAARLAADKAKDEGVKRYASMLVDHHMAANQELMTLAQSKGITLPTSMPAGKRRELNRLNALSGDEFDAAFVQMVGIREHRKDIRSFRRASGSANDPELKAWAGKMLPTLEQHMTEARALPAAKRPMRTASAEAAN